MLDLPVSRQYDISSSSNSRRFHFIERRKTGMSDNKKHSREAIALMVMAVIASLLLPTVASAQQKGAPKNGEAKAAATPFAEAVAKAKETGQPLVVFGMSEGCHRCQGLKEGITTEPEFKELLGQYVSAEVPFGGREFVAIFSECVRQDKSIPPSIGAPAVFIFTSQGKAVYAGPNRESGIAPDDEFKKLLATGIEKNGPPRKTSTGAKASKPADATSEKSEASQPLPRLWKSKSGKFSVTATLVSFDGVTAKLQKSDGAEVSVPLDALSAEDQRFLQESRPKK